MQVELYDLELGCEIAEVGIHTLPELEPHLGDPSQMVERVRAAVTALLGDGKLPVMLGGEHTLTAGAIAACAARHPNLGILYLDAHADVREPYLGAEFNHASALRLSRRHLRDQDAVVAVGIRSMASEEVTYVSQTHLHVVPAHTVAATRRSGPAALSALWEDALQSLGPTERKSGG